MPELQSLIGEITELSHHKKVVCVAIDGVGGAGKTSLAISIQKGVAQTAILQLDDFYAPTLRAPDLLRLKEQVVLPLHAGQEARYQVYEWKTQSMSDWRVLEPAGVFIFEGVYALDRQLRDYYDLKIWIDCPPEVGFSRGVARDLARDGVDNSEQWRTFWMPLEEKYRNEQEPYRCADHRMDGASGIF